MSQANAAQAEFWNGEISRRWLAHEREQEAMLADVTALALDLAQPAPGESVIELGCGAGALALALGRAVGPGGRVLGIDISAPLLKRAAERRDLEGLAQVGFQFADAQEASLPAATFDLVVSHFGAMFFADPVAAYRNLRSALRPGARLAMVVWAAAAENPFFAHPRRAAVARLGSTAPVPADAPGPFALADPARIESILAGADFTAISVRPAACRLYFSGDAAALAQLTTEMGPASAVIREKEASEADRAAIRAEIAKAFAPFAKGRGLEIPALVNLVEARNPG